MSVHRGGLAAFTNTAPNAFPILRVNLPPGRAPGAHVMIERTGERTQHAEYACGGGWLSQNAPSLFFGLGKGTRKGVVTVRWPGGRLWVQSFDENRLSVTAPAN